MILKCLRLFIVLTSLSTVVFLNTAQAHILSSVSLDSLIFVSPDYKNTEQNIFTFVGLNFKTDSNIKKTNPNIFNLNLSMKYAIGQPVLNYINLKEIFFLQALEDFNISYGRKLQNWSGLDKIWNFGFFQPQFRWNSLDTSPQGLFGIFFDNNSYISKQNFNWTVFGSPIYLPDQGPGYDLKEGKFQNSNPWFNTPPQNIEFKGQVFPIDYNLAVPKANDVIFQTLFGAKVGYLTNSGYFVNGAYLSKPSHQIALTYKAVLVANTVKIDILPVIYREQNYALDFGYADSDWNLKMNILGNQPQVISHTTNYNFPEIKSSTSFSPELNINLNKIKLSSSVIFVEGGETADQGPDANQLSNSLTVKYRFKSAYQLSGTLDRKISKNGQYITKLTWVEAFKNASKTIKWTNSFIFYKSWKLYTDLIFIETSDEASSISHLRNLDQIWIGASYEY